MKAHGRALQAQFPRRKNLIFPGFTLIELLVVIAIIGLLTAVLLPALRKAKSSAHSVVCRAHLRGAGLGVRTYIEEHENWLPGPNTSGLRAAAGELPVSSSDPVQNVDWISPTMGNELGFAGPKTQRISSMFNTDLHCPANNVRYDYAYPGSIPGLNPQDLHYSSYSAAIMHHMVSVDDNLSGKVVNDQEIYKEKNHIRIGRGYRPKLDRVGTPGRKIWAMDGARFYDILKGTSFNDLPYQNDGGNFMLSGPIYPLSGDPYKFDFADINDPGTWELKEITRKLAYRHDKRINVVFMDGHCETLGLLESLVPSYYIPSGSYITSMGASAIIAPNVSEGYVR